MSSALNIVIAIGFMGSLGLLLALVLVIANRRLYVYEDPRIDEVEDLLPKANCGACGTAGCRDFAEKLVAGETQPGKCTVNSADMNQFIAGFLGVDLGAEEKQVARLACAGGNHVAKRHGTYQGVDSCRAAALISGGGKGCVWGCLGLADCREVCDFDAIFMDKNELPQVINDLCTACGDCIDICPRDLFSLQTQSQRLWVACKNLEKGEKAESECIVACNGCGRCVMDAPENLITIENNLAIVDYRKNSLASRVAIERCPTGAIVWLEDGIQKGHQAVKVIRKEPLPVQ